MYQVHQLHQAFLLVQGILVAQWHQPDRVLLSLQAYHHDQTILELQFHLVVLDDPIHHEDLVNLDCL